MRSFPAALLSAFAFLSLRAAGATVPAEPLEIGHEPQFVLDLHVVDTTWGLKPKGEPVKRVLRQRAEDKEACIFLAPNGLCYVHARQGMEAKPNACQMLNSCSRNSWWYW